MNKLTIQKQFLKFIIIGGLSTIINYSVFYLIFKILDINYILSSALGFISGVFFGFGFNKNWTFQIQDKNKNFILKYILTYTASLFLGLVFLKIQVTYLKIPVLISNIFTIGLTTCTNFIATKFWVFKA